MSRCAKKMLPSPDPGHPILERRLRHSQGDEPCRCEEGPYNGRLVHLHQPIPKAILADVVRPASNNWFDRRFEHEPASHGRQRHNHRQPGERLPQRAIGGESINMQHITASGMPGSMRSRQDRLDRRPLRSRPCQDKTTEQQPRRHTADETPSQSRRKPDAGGRTRRSHQEREAGGVGSLGARKHAGHRGDGGQQRANRCCGHTFERRHTAGGKDAEHDADKRPAGPLAGPRAPPQELAPTASRKTDRQRDISDRRDRQHGGRQHGDAARLIRGCSGTPPSQPATHGKRDPRRRSPQVDADEQPKPARHCPPRCRKQPVHDAALII